MQRLTEQILEHARRLPEGTPVAAKSLLHLGNRAAVDQALSRLAERGQLLRAAHPGWDIVVLAPDPDLARAMGASGRPLARFLNGGLRVEVWRLA